MFKWSFWGKKRMSKMTPKKPPHQLFSDVAVGGVIVKLLTFSTSSYIVAYCLAACALHDAARRSNDAVFGALQ